MHLPQLPDEPPAVGASRDDSSRRFRLQLAGVACTALWAVICLVAAAQPISGTPRMIGPSHDDEHFPTVNAVSGTPAEWIAAICTPYIPSIRPELDPVSVSGALLVSPRSGLELPGSTFDAACAARERSASEPSILVAEYPSEDPMQHDLAQNGFEWYCFAATGGHLFVAATRATEQTTDSGWSVSPVLLPLAVFGFNIYNGPGH